jgi:UDP-glucose:(heptosyl)LPS alpha-1,3-glucosyltransferase
MRVALVHLRQRGTGGTERYLDQLAGHLVERGHAVTVVCRSHEAPPRPEVEFAVLRPPALGGAWRAWAFARAVERHVARSTYDVVFSLGRTWTHDVIRLGGGCHATFLELGRSGEERWRGCVDRLRDRVVLDIERRGLAPGAYTAVVTNSQMVKKDVMQRHAVPEDRLTVIYNGVDLRRFRPARRREGTALRRDCGLADGDLVVVFLGTGYARKGLSPLLDAFPAFLRTCPNARLLVVGYDSQRRRFERQAERNGVDAAVRFLGGRRDAEVCLAASDIYALPTRYDPFANSTLEALASGLPVVTTSADGASEVIEPGRHGSVIAAPAGAEALYRELVFWSDAERRRRAAHDSRVLAERFPQERTAADSAALLEAVAAKKKRRRPEAGSGEAR